MNQHLIKLCEHWDYDTKGNMMQDIEEDMENGGMTLIESVEALVDRYFLLWILEAKFEDIEFYTNYQCRFRDVLKELKEEL